MFYVSTNLTALDLSFELNLHLSRTFDEGLDVEFELNFVDSLRFK